MYDDIHIIMLLFGSVAREGGLGVSPLMPGYTLLILNVSVVGPWFSTDLFNNIRSMVILYICT